MAPRRVVYTSLFGGYEPLLDQPVAADSDLDFVVFTDDETMQSKTWDVRLVPPAFPADRTRSSRRVKILAHQYLPDYDESLYIDNSVLLTRPPEALFADLLPDDSPMAVLTHSFRGPVREEFAAVVKRKREIDIICAEQLAHYEQTAPAALADQTLWAGILLRRHGDPAVQAAMQMWWEHVLRYSRRDQLSLPFVLLASGLPHRRHELNNFATDYHVWPREDLGRDPADGLAPDLAAGLRQEVARAEARVQRAEGRVEAAKQRIERLRARLDRLERRADRAERTVAAMRGSTSWQITRPLRAVTGRARRLRGARRAAGRGRRSG